MTDQSRPATGYPAPQQQPPPQQPPNNNYYYPNHNPYNYYQGGGGGGGGYYQAQPARPTFFRRFFAALIAVFIIFGVILLIVWLVLRPRIPTFTLTSLSLTSLNISSSPSQISGTWSLNFSVSNPNTKLHVYYDDLEARLFYRRSFISLNQLPPFDQGTKNLTTLDAVIVASHAYVDPDLLNSFNADRSKGSVNFDVRLVAIVRFKAGGWRARRRFLRVYCDHLTLSFSSSSSNKANLTNSPTRCDVAI